MGKAAARGREKIGLGGLPVHRRVLYWRYPKVGSARAVQTKGGVLVSTKSWRRRLHAEEAWWASLKSLGKKINANDYEDLALAA